MFTSSLIVFSAVLALTAGSPQYPAPPPSYAPVEEPTPYSYQYTVQDPESGNDFSAQEDSDGKVILGSYKVALPDGRIQTVTYTVSGDSGYVADVAYEGTASYPDPQPAYTYSN